MSKPAFTELIFFKIKDLSNGKIRLTVLFIIPVIFAITYSLAFRSYHITWSPIYQTPSKTFVPVHSSIYNWWNTDLKIDELLKISVLFGSFHGNSTRLCFYIIVLRFNFINNITKMYRKTTIVVVKTLLLRWKEELSLYCSCKNIIFRPPQKKS
jgi:hypothetical protein